MNLDFLSAHVDRALLIPQGFISNLCRAQELAGWKRNTGPTPTRPAGSRPGPGLSASDSQALISNRVP